MSFCRAETSVLNALEAEVMMLTAEIRRWQCALQTWVFRTDMKAGSARRTAKASERGEDASAKSSRYFRGLRRPT